jgi:diacylglycerol O-acyltransferase
MALNVTVQSYAGRLDYGLIACRRALPDVTDLGDHLLAEHQVLLAKAQAAAAKTLEAEPAPAAQATTPKLKLTAVKPMATPRSRAKAKSIPVKRARA